MNKLNYFIEFDVAQRHFTYTNCWEQLESESFLKGLTSRHKIQVMPGARYKVYVDVIKLLHVFYSQANRHNTHEILIEHAFDVKFKYFSLL